MRTISLPVDRVFSPALSSTGCRFTRMTQTLPRGRLETPSLAGALGEDAAVTVRRMGLQDLPFAVRAHLQHFPEGFFVKLGPRYLEKYYRTYLDGPLACALVAEADGEVCGYLTGVLRGAEHRRLLLEHHGVALGLAGVLGMVRHPSAAFTFATTRLRRYLTALRAQRRPVRVGDSEVSAVLAHIVVREPHRCRGIGSSLVEEFLTQARDAGCTRASLVTSAGPCGAGAFYEHSGWRSIPGVVARDGRVLLRYEYLLRELVGEDHGAPIHGHR